MTFILLFVMILSVAYVAIPIINKLAHNWKRIKHLNESTAHKIWTAFKTKNNAPAKNNQFIESSRHILLLAIFGCIIFLFGNVFLNNPVKEYGGSVKTDTLVINKDNGALLSAVNQLQIAEAENKKAIAELQKKIGKGSTTGLGVFFKIVFWLLLFPAVVYWIFMLLRKKKVATVVAGLVSIGSAFSLSKLMDSLLNNEFSLWPESQIIFYQKNINRNSEVNADSSNSYNFKTDTISFGTFISGMNYIDSDSLPTKIDSLKSRLKSKKYKELVISGGVDVRQPVKDSRKIYGDNLSLSQARAVYVKKIIRDSIPEVKDASILVLPGGAIKYDTIYDSVKHAQNRMVYIYAKY